MKRIVLVILDQIFIGMIVAAIFLPWSAGAQSKETRINLEYLLKQVDRIEFIKGTPAEKDIRNCLNSHLWLTSDLNVQQKRIAGFSNLIDRMYEVDLLNSSFLRDALERKEIRSRIADFLRDLSRLDPAEQKKYLAILKRLHDEYVNTTSKENENIIQKFETAIKVAIPEISCPQYYR